MSTDVETVKAVEWMLESAGRLGRTITRLPSPSPGEILVATSLGAISPGTERTLLHGNSPFVEESRYPYQPGSLNVVKILAASDRTLVGERGIAILGHRDFALIPYGRFIRIPAGIPDETALLGVLAADARHAIEVAAVEAAEDCLVVGGGILGVLAAWELAIRSEGRVRLVERDEGRRAMLVGVRFPREVQVSDGAGSGPWHTVFECANTADAFRLAQRAARPGGSIVLVADGCHERYVLEPDFFAKGLYLGKTDSNPDLRGFLGEWFARHEERESLVEVAFQGGIRFADFPQAYLEALLSPREKRAGLVPLVRYE